MAITTDALPPLLRSTPRMVEPVLFLADGVRDGCDPERMLLAPGLHAAAGNGVAVVERAALGAARTGPGSTTSRFDRASATDTPADAFVAGSLRPLFASRLTELRYRRTHERAWRARCADEAARLASIATAGERVVMHGVEALGIASALTPRRAPRLALLLDVAIPAPELLAQLPSHARLFGALACFELVAVPTERDAANLRAYCARELDATLLPAGALRLRGRPLRVVVLPPGIDASARAAQAAAVTPVARTDVFAFDAVDASRALTQRLRAWSRVLARHEADERQPSLLQLLAPVPADPNARALRRRVLALATRINGRHGDPDAIPVRCVGASGGTLELAALQRASRVGLSTPVADAVGIGAQDWIACQDPADPGVLVLSRHAAAAPWLDGALLVDARDPGDCATAIERALAMPLAERRNRWQCAWRALLKRDAGRWLDTLLARWRDAEIRAPLAATRVVAMRPPAIAAACDPQR